MAAARHIIRNRWFVARRCTDSACAAVPFLVQIKRQDARWPYSQGGALTLQN